MLLSGLRFQILLKIAQENAVAETAFFVDNGCSVHLRWFTPDIEIDLCGHGTLAAAHVLRSILKLHQRILVKFCQLSVVS